MSLFIVIGTLVVFLGLPLVALISLIQRYDRDPFPHVLGTVTPKNSREFKL